jgi:hypothetical protein
MGSAFLGRGFWWTTAENVAIVSAGGAATPLAEHQHELLSQIPWDLVGSGAVVGALLGFLYSIVTLLRKNGAASLSPDVIATELVAKRSGGWDPTESNPVDFP